MQPFLQDSQKASRKVNLKLVEYQQRSNEGHLGLAAILPSWCVTVFTGGQSPNLAL